MIYSRIFCWDILLSVTDISMHTLLVLDLWTRYHDKILLESARLSIDWETLRQLADSHIVTGTLIMIVTVTLRARATVAQSLTESASVSLGAPGPLTKLPGPGARQ